MQTLCEHGGRVLEHALFANEASDVFFMTLEREESKNVLSYN